MKLADTFPFYPMLGQSRVADPVDHAAWLEAKLASLDAMLAHLTAAP